MASGVSTVIMLCYNLDSKNVKLLQDMYFILITFDGFLHHFLIYTM